MKIRKKETGNRKILLQNRQKYMSARQGWKGGRWGER